MKMFKTFASNINFQTANRPKRKFLLLFTNKVSKFENKSKNFNFKFFKAK